MPIWLVNDPEGPVLIVLAEAKVPEPGLNAGEAVGVEWLGLLRKLLQPLIFLRGRGLRLCALRGLAERWGKVWWWGLNSQMRKGEGKGFGLKGVKKWELL